MLTKPGTCSPGYSQRHGQSTWLVEPSPVSTIGMARKGNRTNNRDGLVVLDNQCKDSFRWKKLVSPLPARIALEEQPKPNQRDPRLPDLPRLPLRLDLVLIPMAYEPPTVLGVRLVESLFLEAPPWKARRLQVLRSARQCTLPGLSRKRNSFENFWNRIAAIRQRKPLSPLIHWFKSFPHKC